MKVIASPMTTTQEQPLFLGLLLMLSLFLLQRLRGFLQKPFRLSLKVPQSGLSMQVKHLPSDEKCPPTTEPSVTPTTDDGNSTARKTDHYERDSTISD